MLCQLVFIIYFSTFITVMYPNLQTEIIKKNNGLDRARMIILKLPYEIADTSVVSKKMSD